jgi:hypothetical protein
MIRWFLSGFALTMGVFAACAVSDKIEHRRRGEEEALFIG